MRTSRTATIVLALIGGLLLAAVLAVTSRMVFGMTDFGERTLSETCLTSPGATDGGGVCVRRIARTELMVVPGRNEIQVFTAVNGKMTGGRYLVNDDPFVDDGPDRIKTDITPAGDVEVSSNTAVTLVFSAKAIASLQN